MTDPVDKAKCHDLALNWENRENVVEEWKCPKCDYRKVTTMHLGCRTKNLAILLPYNEQEL